MGRVTREGTRVEVDTRGNLEGWERGGTTKDLKVARGSTHAERPVWPCWMVAIPRVVGSPAYQALDAWASLPFTACTGVGSVV